jgi:hypothetical protein
MPIIYRREKVGVDRDCKREETFVLSQLNIPDDELHLFLLGEVVSRNLLDEDKATVKMHSGAKHPPTWAEKVASYQKGYLSGRLSKRNALVEKMKKGLEDMKYDTSTGEVFGVRRTVKTRRRRKKKKKHTALGSNWVVGMPKPK